MRVESAAAKDGAQGNDDRCGVTVATHLADKAAPGFECPPDTGKDSFWRAHPMQRRIRKHRVELVVESEILPAGYTRIDAAGPRRGDHARRRVDGND